MASGTTSDDLLEYTLKQTNTSISGSTILYCIDTTDTCTPNINYTDKVYSKNNGSYYFRFQITSGAGKKSSGSYRAIVNDTTYCAVNLIKNGSFEQGDIRWKDDGYSNYFTISTTSGYSGTNSMQFGYDNSNKKFLSMSDQWLEMDAPELNHKYYGALMFKSSSTFTVDDDRFEWYTGDSDGRSTLIFACKNIKTNNIWTKLSAIKSVTTSEYLSKKWLLRNFQSGANEYSYSDDLVLIDLTDTFGAGNEPDKEWCDHNLSWFEGRKIVYKSNYVDTYDGIHLLYESQGGIKKDNSIILPPATNATQFGPYIHLELGCYRIIYYGKNLNNKDLNFKSYIAGENSNTVFSLLSLEKSNHIASYYINLVSDFDRIEFIVSNNSTTIESQVDKIMLYKSDKCPVS